MADKPIPRRVVLLLIAGVLVPPLVAWTLVGVSALLGVMGDAEGAVLLNRVAAAFGALWIVDLIALVAIQAINSLSDRDER